MSSAVFVVNDYELDTFLVYRDPADQVREMKKIFERAKVKDLHHVHFCLDSDNVDEENGESDYEDEEGKCESCGRNCGCREENRKRKWTSEEHEQCIAELLSNRSLETPEEWFALLKEVVADETLDDDVNFSMGTLM